MKLLLLHDALVWYGMVFVAYGPPQRPVFGPGSASVFVVGPSVVLQCPSSSLARKGWVRGGSGYLAISSRVAGLPLLFFFVFCAFCLSFFCHFAILGSFILIVIVLNVLFWLFLAFFGFFVLGSRGGDLQVIYQPSVVYVVDE